MKRFIYVLFVITVSVALSGVPSRARAAAIIDDEIGVAVYPNATEMPDVATRLLEDKGPTWIAARAYRTDDSIKNVVKYFRDLAAKARKPGNEFTARLVDRNWDVNEGTLSTAHVVFGVAKELRGIAKEKTKTSFGTILLDDSFVRIHVLTPYPVPPAGMTVADGTMIVMIRERMIVPAATALDSGVQEQVYTGREVTKKVRLRSKPEPESVPGIRGRVVLKAVFASSGKVTNIVVVEGVPGLTEVSIRAARQIKFDPAIKDGRYVAQWMQLEYNFF